MMRCQEPGAPRYFAPGSFGCRGCAHERGESMQELLRWQVAAKEVRGAAPERVEAAGAVDLQRLLALGVTGAQLLLGGRAEDAFHVG